MTVNNVIVHRREPCLNGPKAQTPAITVTGVIRDAGWLENLTATVDWDDGTAVQNITAPSNVRPDATLTFSVPHTYGDDGVFNAEVCGFDDDTSTCQTIALTITNVNPTADIDVSGATEVNGKPTIFGQADSPVTFNGDMTDPGSDDLFATWVLATGHRTR